MQSKQEECKRGAAPLRSEEIGPPTMVRMPQEMRMALDRYGRLNSLPSRAAVVRLACRRLLANEGGT